MVAAESSLVSTRSRALRRLVMRVRTLILAAASSSEIETFSATSTEAIETPPSPVRMVMMLTICSLFALSVLVACLCKLDIHAVVQGKIQAVGRSKVVQPLDNGRVTSVHVQNGSRVQRGQELLVLDPTESLADEREHSQQLGGYKAEIARRQAAIQAARQALTGQVVRVDFSPDVDPQLLAREQAVLDGDLNNLRASLASLAAKRAESLTHQAALKNTIASEDQLIATLTRRVDMRRDLEKQHWETNANVLDAIEARDREIASRTDHEGQLLDATATAASALRQMDEAVAKFISDNSEALATAEAKRDEAAQEVVKSADKVTHTRIVSPIDGTVQELAVTTIGQVVARGQQLMVVVPRDAPIEIEALASNTDIGFIHTGQSAVAKIDTFPYTIFGTVPGKVVNVSRDAVYAGDPHQALPTAQEAAEGSESQGASGSSTAPRAQNFVFPVTVMLDKSTISVGTEGVSLSPGMTVEVEILTGRRRVIDYILSPLREVGSEALRER